MEKMLRLTKNRRKDLMDLSRTYELLPDNLLRVQLEAYGFSDDSLLLACSYLENRYQRLS